VIRNFTSLAPCSFLGGESNQGRAHRVANAASISGLLLTTEALVTEIPEKEKTPPMPGGGMGGMDY
jgi:hypothetical protein